MNDYGSELDEILERHDAELLAFGEKILNKLVEPACKKHRLTFTSGMGAFYFRKRTKTRDDHMAEPMYSSRHELDMATPRGYIGLSDAAKTTLGPILDLLNREISYEQYVGYLLGDVP